LVHFQVSLCDFAGASSIGVHQHYYLSKFPQAAQIYGALAKGRFNLQLATCNKFHSSRLRSAHSLLWLLKFMPVPSFESMARRKFRTPFIVFPDLMVLWVSGLAAQGALF
jgi:hypothetical protein